MANDITKYINYAELNSASKFLNYIMLRFRSMCGMTIKLPLVLLNLKY